MTTGYKILTALGIIAVLYTIYWMLTKNKKTTSTSATETKNAPRTATEGRNIQCPNPGEVFGFDNQSNTWRCHPYSSR